jgi:predicted DNA-binding transcriptional regulator YafY
MRKYYFDTLVKTVSDEMAEITGNPLISSRTIKYDIQYMIDNYDIELESDLKDGKKKIYRYKDINFSINNLAVNLKEIEKITDAFAVLQRIQGLEDFGWVQESLPRFQNLLGIQKPVISFSKNDRIYYIENLFLRLYNAIVHKKVLKISYQDFNSSEPYYVIFHPYHIKEYNRRWFVFGKNQENGVETWNLALDRFKGIEVLENSSFENSEINWFEYFDDIVGVTRKLDGIVEPIIIETDLLTWKYINSKPFHISQKKISEAYEKVVFKLEVIINRELKNQLLSFGSSLRVLEPSSLAGEMKEEFLKAISLYEE